MLISIVLHKPVAGLAGLAMDALRAQGHEIAVFNDAQSFLGAADTIARMDVLVAVGIVRIDAELMDRAPNLRALISPVTGTEAFDEREASARGILVCNGQIEENYTGMGEAAVMLALVALYTLHDSERRLRENLPRPVHLTARQMMGKNVGIIGFGQIGQVIASRLAGWKTEILTYVRTPRPLPEGITAVSLDELLQRSDVVFVATALNDQTRGMLGLDKLRLMKPNVVFVNISRGGIAPDDDLATLAKERPEMTLALDVFDPEPLKPDSPLRDLDNAILTPHMVGHTVETHDRLPVVLMENIEAVLGGRVPEFVCNREVLDTWKARWGG